MLECTRTGKVMMWNYYKIITYYNALQSHNVFRNIVKVKMLRVNISHFTF